jgi:hypothetical protein
MSLNMGAERSGNFLETRGKVSNTFPRAHVVASSSLVFIADTVSGSKHFPGSGQPCLIAGLIAMGVPRVLSRKPLHAISNQWTLRSC